MGEDLQSRFFKAQDGLLLHALLLGEDSADAPIVCLPGLSRPARDFAVLAADLHARKPRKVICLDYRGRGGSDWDPDWTHYSIPVEAADIGSALEQFGVNRAIFIGLSRGGLHAMLLAAAKPGLVKALVLNDVGPSLDPGGLARIKGYIGHLPLLRDFDEAAAHYQRMMGAQFPAVPIEHWRHYAENSLNATPERLRLSYDPQLARLMDSFDPEAPLPDFWPQFEAIVAPILTLRGENSDMLSQATLQEMAARNPLCQTHIVPGQGHTPLLLDAPTLERVAAFIDGVDQTP
jgi:pimeloyl-ACP methyl ester carboxylesterase